MMQCNKISLAASNLLDHGQQSQVEGARLIMLRQVCLDKIDY